MTTLFDAMLETARCLQSLRSGTATGGSTTTLINTAMSEPDDWFNGGVLFLPGTKVTTTPTDWVSSTNTLTFPALATAITAGTAYSLCGSRWSREMLVQAVNTALTEMGIPTTTSVITSVQDQSEYTLTNIENIKRVEIAQNDAEPYDYAPHFSWREVDGELVFLSKLPGESGKNIRLWHNNGFSNVTADAALMPDGVHILRIAWNAAYYALLSRSALSENSETVTKNMLDLVEMKRAEANNRYGITKLQRDPILPGYVK